MATISIDSSLRGVAHHPERQPPPVRTASLSAPPIAFVNGVQVGSKLNSIYNGSTVRWWWTNLDASGGVRLRSQQEMRIRPPGEIPNLQTN
ncbi:MAG: hypothetical protein IPI24_00740 [Ignavibacteria bacterium]|nr:hypothetical protein [Ignavibacteria bacterium]